MAEVTFFLQSFMIPAMQTKHALSSAVCPSLIITDGWQGYALLDCGNGRKLEQFGPYKIDRPDPQAMGPCHLPQSVWDKADAVFVGDSEETAGRWRCPKPLPESWDVVYKGVTFQARLTPFRHMGYFPEQAPHWDWMAEKLQGRTQPRLLNLFAYTGVASLLAAKAGASVTHLDASKKAVQWARDNAERSGLKDAPIRWITEDARSFVAREARRGVRYDGILLDPPKFGRGTENEVWDLFTDLPALLTACQGILAADGFLILTSYAVRASWLSLHELCRSVFPAAGLQGGELVVRERSDRAALLSTSLFCRVSHDG
jgi:23S rRNA (cytosine1962-C5)-methyltransferase